MHLIRATFLRNQASQIRSTSPLAKAGRPLTETRISEHRRHTTSMLRPVAGYRQPLTRAAPESPPRGAATLYLVVSPANCAATAPDALRPQRAPSAQTVLPVRFAQKRCASLQASPTTQHTHTAQTIRVLRRSPVVARTVEPGRCCPRTQPSSISAALHRSLDGFFPRDIPCWRPVKGRPIHLLLRHLQSSGGNKHPLPIPVRILFEGQNPSNWNVAISDNNLLSVLHIVQITA